MWRVQRNYQDYQRKLAEYCRTGEATEIPGITSGERLETYRRLVFSVIEEFLGKAYPITQAAIGKDEWQTLVDRFFSEYPCSSPQVWRMPQELTDYVEKTSYKSDEFPYLLELLHFEWLEIEIDNMEDGELPEYLVPKDLFHEIPVINPDHKLLQLSYPLYELTPDILSNDEKREERKGTYLLLGFRCKETLRAKFLTLNPFSLILLKGLMPGDKTTKELLEQLPAELQKLPNAAQTARVLIESFYKSGLILGSKKRESI